MWNGRSWFRSRQPSIFGKEKARRNSLRALGASGGSRVRASVEKQKIPENSEPDDNDDPEEHRKRNVVLGIDVISTEGDVEMIWTDAHGISLRSPVFLDRQGIREVEGKAETHLIVRPAEDFVSGRPDGLFQAVSRSITRDPFGPECG